jgi:hypothetical protein
MTRKEETRSRVGGITRKRRRRSTTLTRESRRRMRIGRGPLPRREMGTKRRSNNSPGVGASTTWCGATTRQETANLVRSA